MLPGKTDAIFLQNEDEQDESAENTLHSFCFILSFSRVPEVTVGDEKISIPSPSGFSEINAISPETVRLFEDMCPPSNRLLAVFLSQGDVGKPIQGETPVFGSYMMVQSLYVGFV